MGTIRDVTENISVLQELENRIQFIELLSDNIPQMLIVTDTNYNIISCNHKFEETYKVRREDINEKNIFDILPGLKQPSFIANLNKALYGEAIQACHVSAGLRYGQLNADIFPLKEPKGNVIGILIVLQDITEEIYLREQLNKEINLIQNLLEFSTDRAMILDEHLHYLLWSKKCEDYYNITAKEALGKNILDFFPAFRKDPSYLNCLKALNGETVYVDVASGSDLFNSPQQYFIPLKDAERKVYGILWLMFNDEKKPPKKSKQGK